MAAETRLPVMSSCVLLEVAAARKTPRVTLIPGLSSFTWFSSEGEAHCTPSKCLGFTGELPGGDWCSSPRVICEQGHSF